MRVIMLLKSDAPSEAGVMPPEHVLSEMGAYSERLLNAGVMVGGEGLHASSKGAKVRISKGKTTVLDGPFAEAKEVVAGYYMLKVNDLAEAIEWAKQLPGADWSPEAEAELRPLYETEDFAVDPAEQPGGWRDQELEARQALETKVPGPEQGPRWISFLKADKNTEAEMEPSTKLLDEMGALMGEMMQQGLLISGEGLRASKHGAKVRVKNGKLSVLDGPFAESKELIAGFSMFRAKTKAEAIEWARRCLQIHLDGTDIDTGEIEVREVFELDAIPATAEELAGTSEWRERELRMRERLSP
jgi:hypothetical protein